MKAKFDFAKYAPFIALVVLFVFSSVASEYFLNFRNITNILRQSSYTGIIGLGLTFVIIAGGIDLSVGSMVALVGGLAIMALNYLGGGAGAIALAFLAALALGAAAGAVNGVFVTKGRIAPFIATLGTMSIFRSLTLYISNAGEVRSQSELFPALGRAISCPSPSRSGSSSAWPRCSTSSSTTPALAATSALWGRTKK